MKILPNVSLAYKDVNLIAQPQSYINSRSKIKRELNRVIVSPMQSVVGETFALEALILGLQVCLPRFSHFFDRILLYQKIVSTNKDYIDKLWFSIGLNEVDQLNWLFTGLSSDFDRERVRILIDVANGYLDSVVRLTNKIKDTYNCEVMVGNIHSAEGLNLYSNIPNIYVRCGIGGGSVCDTSIVTGYTRGQIIEISECLNNRHGDQNIVADGGIRTSGDAVKAFGAGADYIMLGGYFALAEEAENIIKGEYKYWGGASHLQQIKHTGKISRHSEGRVKDLDKSKIKPLSVLVEDLWGGISSGVSYSGYSSLTNFIGNGVFEIKNG